MGAHTAVGYALAHPERLSGLVIDRADLHGRDLGRESLAYWDGLASGAGSGRDRRLRRLPDPRERRRRAPGASRWRGSAPNGWSCIATRGELARALRETPASRPFGSLEELAGLDVPALVVASGDEADPGHPYAVAEAYAAALPRARLISEDEGQSPLAWQGGRLSREISLFAVEPDVALSS